MWKIKGVAVFAIFIRQIMREIEEGTWKGIILWKRPDCIQIPIICSSKMLNCT